MSYYHACTDCGCPGVEHDHYRCGSCAGLPDQPPNPAAPAPIAPPEAAGATETTPYEPTEADLADYHAWCQEQDHQARDMMDAHREMEYQDMMDARL